MEVRFLESVWLKKRKGVVTLYKLICRHIHQHSQIHTFQTRRIAVHGPAADLDLKTCCISWSGGESGERVNLEGG